MKLLCVIISVLLIGIVGVNSLQCYVCENCPTPTEADLLSCDEPVTAAPSSTSAAPSSTSTQSTAGSTQSTAAPTQSTAAPTQSTAAPTQSTAAPTQSTAAPTQSTAAPTQSTAAPTQSTAAPTQSTTAPAQPTQSPPDVTVRRYKRSILSLVNSNKTECNCKNEVGCSCDNRLSSRVDHVCFKVVMKKDNVIVRGCAPATLDSKAPCQVEDVIAAVTSCSTCDTDQCNSGYMTQFSVYMLVATIGVILIK